MSVLTYVMNLFSGGLLDRILDSVDKHVDASTERAKIKANLVETYYTNRVGYMRSGGFWLMLIFAVPLACWWSAVILYSIFWCKLCIYPQSWSIAALPSPLNDWAGLIIVAIFGVVGVTQLKR